jgi:hypothetical protein
VTWIAHDLTWRDAFALSAALAGAGSVLQGIQLVAIRRELRGGGLLNWSVLRMSHPVLVGSRFSPLADRLLAPPAFFGVVALQIAAGVLVVANGSTATRWALCVLLALRVLINFRNGPAILGADQMHLVVLAACTLAALGPPSIAAMCGWFVGMQLVLAYVTAGLWKLSTPGWRDGSAVAGILRTRTLGLRRGYVWAARHPALATGAGAATIAFESAAPWLIFGGSSACAVFLVAGLVFHVTVMIATALDDFLWAFVAAYPIALRCAMDVDRFWTP